MRKTLLAGAKTVSADLDRWAYGCGVDLKRIAAGKPTPNAYIEGLTASFATSVSTITTSTT